jgi:hypothetical protein
MMAGMAALDHEFTHAVLAQRIVRGAAERDPVRLHGAILAALELHPQGVAVASIFAPALREAGRVHGQACRRAVAAAIREQLKTGPQRPGYADGAPAC